MEYKLSYVESINREDIQNFERAEQRGTVGMKVSQKVSRKHSITFQCICVNAVFTTVE